MSDRDRLPRWSAAAALIGFLAFPLWLSPTASASPALGAAPSEVPGRPDSAVPFAAIDDQLLDTIREILAGRGPGFPVGPGLYRLHGTEPDLPYDDLEPLRFLLRDATFVGLGESIHTSGGFYEMKHRLFRFLVEDMGFRAFGFESPWVAAEAARAYVATCNGTSLEALRSLFSVWQSTQTQALLEWMCQWNQAHPGDPVHFYGFDIQNFAAQNTTPLLEFLARLGHGEGDPLVEGIQVCDGAETFYYPDRLYPPDLYQQCQAALTATEELFDEDEKEIVGATSRHGLAWARVHLVSAQSWQEEIFYIHTDFSRGYAARDRGMAYVVAAIRDLRFPRERVALWAHNGHIMKHGLSTNAALRTMGTFLDEAWGRRYASVALAAFETFLEWPWIDFCGGPYNIFGQNPVERLLEATGESTLLLSFDPPGRATFLNPSTAYSIGDIGGIPSQHHDALIYLEASPAMDPLFTPTPCP